MYRRSLLLLGGTFLVYALLVATHLGEFWPFSIYPMFSQGGHPWSRAVVLDVSDEAAIDWAERDVDALPGTPYPLLPNGIDPIDLANFVSKTTTWDADRLAGLQRMFYDQLDDRRLLVVRVDGHIDERDSVVVRFRPTALLAQDTAYVAPALQPTAAR